MIRRLGKLYYRLKGYFPVTINGQHFKCDPFHPGFWHIVNKGGFEHNYFKILDAYLPPNGVSCDIGSWIGPIAIYASPDTITLKSRLFRLLDGLKITSLKFLINNFLFTPP